MKTLILLLATLIFLTSCVKLQTPEPSTSSFLMAVTKQDTMPLNAELRIKLAKDSINSDETMLEFNPQAGLNYSSSWDAPYFVGFGLVSLSSISNDNRDLAIYGLPYKLGMGIRLRVITKGSGNFSLLESYNNKIPANIQIWLKDNLLKDSANLCSKIYNFSVDKADTNTFGNKRFILVLKQTN